MSDHLEFQRITFENEQKEMWQVWKWKAETAKSEWRADSWTENNENQGKQVN